MTAPWNRNDVEVKTRERLKIDLSTLIERNAAFEPDKPAIHFEGAPLTLTLLSAHSSGEHVV